MADLKKLADQLVSLTIKEAADLAKILEEEHGIKPAATAVAAAPAGGEGGDEPAAAEQTEFDVILNSFGTAKIAVIKEVRQITGLGLKEAKGLVDKAPSEIKQGVSKEEADEVRQRLEGVGAQVEVR